MDRTQLLHELDQIIESGVADGYHDTEIMKEARDQLQETDLDAMKRILSSCKCFNGHWDVNLGEAESGKKVFDITIRDFADSVTLCFDEDGRLIG